MTLATRGHSNFGGPNVSNLDVWKGLMLYVEIYFFGQQEGDVGNRLRDKVQSEPDWKEH